MTVKVINRSSNPLPQYATPLSAGLDVRADNPEPIVLGPLCRAMVPTGLFLEIPAGYEESVALLTKECAEALKKVAGGLCYGVGFASLADL